jgi:glycosyltransferase involved in cell wall biosynthesis
MGAPLTREQRDELSGIPNLEICESTYKLEWMNDPWNDVAVAGDWLLELEQEVQPNLVHLNSYAFAARSWNSPVMVVGHSCVLSWWRAVHQTNAPDDYDSYRRAVRDGLQSADLVVAPSHAMLGCLKEHYGPLLSTMVIPNGRLSLPPTQRRKQNLIFTAGRLWDPGKNISTLDKIAPHLRWPVFVAGEAAHPDAGRTLRTSNMYHLGQLSSHELQTWLERVSIYVSPARYEPFGLAILEAALAGCALVLGDIPSLREIWGDAALYVHPEDQEGLCAVLQELTVNPAKLASHGAKARRTAAKYSLQTMANGYQNAYAGLLASPQNLNPIAVLTA